MLVNENRLNLADARARQYLARQMENHFFGQGADVAQGYVPPKQNDACAVDWLPTAFRRAALSTSITPKSRA